MKKTKKIVITNHTDKFVEWYDILLKHGYTSDDIIIYDRDHLGFNGENLDPKRFDKYGTVIKTRNVGTNIWTTGKYIVDNYDNLPDIVIFLKCNVLQREHTTQEILEYALDANYFVPIEADPFENQYMKNSACFVNDRIFAERVDPNQLDSRFGQNDKVYPRIKNYGDFINDLFLIPKMPDYICFAPGHNYVVPKENILKYSKNFYKKMMLYTDYSNADTIQHGPVESHWFERICDMAWQGHLKENMSYIVNDEDLKD